MMQKPKSIHVNYSLSQPNQTEPNQTKTSQTVTFPVIESLNRAQCHVHTNINTTLYIVQICTHINKN